MSHTQRQEAYMTCIKVLLEVFPTRQQAENNFGQFCLQGDIWYPHVLAVINVMKSGKMNLRHMPELEELFERSLW